MGQRYVQLVVAIGLIIVFLAAAIGCSQPQSKPAPNQGSGESKPVPGELKQLQNSLDQLYKELKPTSPAETGGNQQEGGQTGQKKGDQGGQQQGGGQGGQTGQEQKQQGGQQEGGEQQAQGAQTEKIDWNKLQTQAERLHDQWNRFETKAVEAGAKQADIDGIEKELDNLPTMIAAKNRSGARLAVNSAAGYLPNFMNLYSTKVPPDLYRMQMLTRGVMLRVDDGDWAGAEQDMLKMNTTWSQLLVQLQDNSKAETDKTHMAQLDLESAVKKRDRMLVLVKGNILEKNLDDLIKKQEAMM